MNRIQTLNSKYKINVLLYHQIGDSPTDETNLNCFCKTTEFYNQMEFLSKSKQYQVISLNTAIDFISSSKNIDKNYVILTFDDGCESFYNKAFPILKSFGFNATVYPITGFLGQHAIINSKNYKHLKIMSEDLIKELFNQGINFGAHTVNHFRLTELPDSAAEFQIKQSKIQLENILGYQIDSFSFPHGKYNDEIIKILEKNKFSNAMTCNSDSFSNNSSLFEIPRKYITYFDDIYSFKKKLI